MGISWDNERKYALLLMIVAQQNDPFRGVDYTALSNQWKLPGDGLTVRAAQEQVKSFRKAIKEIADGEAPTLTSRRSAPSTPRKPVTPATPSSKRRGAAITSSTAKKRRIISNDSEDSAEMTDSSRLNGGTDDDDVVAQRRTLPARAKSRGQTYRPVSDSDDVGVIEIDDSDGDYERPAVGQMDKMQARQRAPQFDSREVTVKPEVDEMGEAATRVTSFETAPEEA